MLASLHPLYKLLLFQCLRTTQQRRDAKAAAEAATQAQSEESEAGDTGETAEAVSEEAPAA